MAYIMTPIAVVISLYLGIHFTPAAWKEALSIMLAVSLVSVGIEIVGNRLIHSHLDRGRKERRAKEKAQMLAEYAALINKAKPRKKKRRPSKRKKR